VSEAARTVHDLVGSEFFEELVDRFYAGVEGDDLLRPMYPDDLGGARRRLALFLIQYWGGPGTYSELRGHPRLRMRHMPFPVDIAARDAWLGHMTAAVQSTVAATGAPEMVGEALLDYFTRSADFLRNTDG
jgi:hemoglobin